MRPPTLHGTIARRILANFRAAPEVVARLLPAPFRPKLHNDFAIIGVCLIRLEKMRFAPCSLPLGLASENAAHRFAVVWDDENGEQSGVFIVRRDTDSRLNIVAGERIFPVQHHAARFEVRQTQSQIDFSMQSCDGEIEIRVKGEIGGAFPKTSIFESLDASSTFFQSGSRGFSTRRDSTQLDGLELETLNWNVENLAVSEAFSSYFFDESRFPQGSVEFDHALLMREIEHQWNSIDAP